MMNQPTCRLCMVLSMLLLALVLGSGTMRAESVFDKVESLSQTEAEKKMDADINKMLHFFNEAKYDSVFPLAKAMMDFCDMHKLVRRKMQAWHMLVGAYHFTGQYNKALHEVRLMYEEARRQGSEYGQSMAYFNMGNVYYSMRHYEESAEAFEKCVPLMFQVDKAVLLQIYPYYCDVLEALKRYDDLDRIIVQWFQVMNQRLVGADESDRKEMLSNYFIACVQGSLGRNKLGDAERYLNDVERNLEDKDRYEYLFLLYYRAKLRMMQGRYDEALTLNNERMRMFNVIEDKTTLIPVHKQRADILMHSGKYKEAAEMYARTYELSDSLNRANTLTQLNELRTMFKVDELETVNAEHEGRLEAMEVHSALQRTRFMTIITTLSSVALLVILLLIWYSARKLRHKNKELGLRNDELKVASERAEASLKMKTDFIHQISHEIRTPLNVLSGFSQILTTSGDSLDDETRMSINHRIVESTDRITNLVNKMLELSEASSETTIERHDEVTPVQIADEAITMTPICSQPHVVFEYATDASIQNVVLRTNLKQTTRTLHLLLGNAVKFLHPQGEDLKQGTVRFFIKPSDDGRFIRFIIEDTGKGVPEEEAEHIFEEFVQLDEYYEGTGVGLTVARSIARRLGGDVVLDTSYKEGARFVFTLPRD